MISGALGHRVCATACHRPPGRPFPPVFSHSKETSGASPKPVQYLTDVGAQLCQYVQDAMQNIKNGYTLELGRGTTDNMGQIVLGS